MNIKSTIRYYRTIIENIIALGSIRLFEYALTLITLPYLLHILGPEKFGIIAFAQGIIQYFLLITEYGFNLTGARNIARCSCDESQCGKVFSAVMGGKICLFFLSTGIFIILLISVDFMQKEIGLYLSLYLLVIGNVLFPIWFFQGIEKMRYITLVNLIARSISVVGIFVLVKTEEHYVIAALLQSATPIIAGLFSFCILFSQYRYVFFIPSFQDVKICLREGWEVFISTISINFYTASNVVVLGFMTNHVAVGYFSAAQKIVFCLQSLITPVSQAIYPYVSRLAALSQEQAMSFLKKCLLLLGGINFIIGIFLLCFAEFIVQIIMGQAYSESVVLLRIMAFIPCIVSLSNIFGVQTMLAFGLQKLFQRIVLESAILNMILLVPFVYFFHEIGLAVVIVVVESFVTLRMLYSLKRSGFHFV